MKTYYLAQGSEAWHAHRNSGYFNASDAASMMNRKNAHSRRDQLLRLYKYRLPVDVDSYLQRRYDDGHRFEALARPLAEAITGDLYPIVGVNGNYSASFDGVTEDGLTTWEHKTLNAELLDLFHRQCDKREFDDIYLDQMSHQFMVNQVAEKCMFSASKWTANNELIDIRHGDYLRDQSRIDAIRAGWEQFARDLAAMPEFPDDLPLALPAPVGVKPDAMPALSVELNGVVTRSNLPAYRDHVITVFGSANRNPKTDQDFADNREVVKQAKSVREVVTAVRSHMLSQSGSIKDAFDALDKIDEAAMRAERDLEAIDKLRKDQIKAELVGDGMRALANLRGELFAEVLAIWPSKHAFIPPSVADNFAGSLRSLRTIESQQNAINSELARLEIIMRQLAALVLVNVKTAIELGRHELWPDLLMLVQKPIEDLRAVLIGRIAQADKVEAERKANELAQVEKATREKEFEREIPWPALPEPLVLGGAITTVREVLSNADKLSANLSIGEISKALGVSVSAELLQLLGCQIETRAAKKIVTSSLAGVAMRLKDHIDKSVASYVSRGEESES